MELNHLNYNIKNELSKYVNNPIFIDNTIYNKNYGALQTKFPLVVICPRNSKELKAIITFSRINKIRINVRGGGFSINHGGGLSLGILIHMNSKFMIPDFILNKNNTVEVSTSMKWQTLEQLLNEKGRSFPVLIAKIGMTIGGTLSTGGYSPGSVSIGGQVNLVEKFKLIKPDGFEIWCSKTENSKYYYNGLGTLGRIGVIERVILKTIPHKNYTAIYKVFHPSLAELVNSLKYIQEYTNEIDVYAGYNINNGFESISCFSLNNQELADNHIFPIKEECFTKSLKKYVKKDFVKDSFFKLNWNKQFYFIWQVYSIGIENAQKFVSFLESSLFKTEIYKEYGRFKLFISKGPSEHGHFPFEPIAESDLVLGFGFNFSISFTDQHIVEELRQLFIPVLAYCLELKGRPYIANSFDITEEEKEELYGIDYTRFKEIKMSLDPEMIFNT